MRKLKISEIERNHLLKAWIAISLAFAIMQRGGNLAGFIFVFVISAFTAGIGFIFHELAHKIVAQRYNCWAEFRADNQMLILMIFMSFFGFLFAAPGAVMISGNVTPSRNGKISASGPLANMILAGIFLGIYYLSPTSIIANIAFYGAWINSFIGLFNLIPFGNFDGSKILRWDKRIYGTMVAFGIVLIILVYLPTP